MGILIKGLNAIAANMTGSLLPSHSAAGAGSSTFSSGDTTLLSESTRAIMSIKDTSNSGSITFTTIFEPNQISGLILKEFGTTTGSIGGNLMNREIVSGTLTAFDGEEEFHVTQTFEFYI